MYINHNGMASNVANTLTSHYSNLATSTQRLSSGLRVNSAADDAAGLAIRELMRADISSLQQGVRNANDAISLIQTADGALGIIDEKLIRMKELAEQAATGTYDSTQRLMIESEYQAMASEITRIANATDFNGMKLLDGSLEGTHDGSGLTATGEMKIHFGTGNDSAEDYYYIRIEEMTAQALGVGNASTWQDVQGRAMNEVKNNLIDSIKADKTLSDEDKGTLLSQVDAVVGAINDAVTKATTDPATAYALWAAADDAATGWDNGFLEAGKEAAGLTGNSTLMENFLQAGATQTAAEAADAAGTLAKTDTQVAQALSDAVTAFIGNEIGTGKTYEDDGSDPASRLAAMVSDIKGEVLKAARTNGYESQEDINALTKAIDDEFANFNFADTATAGTPDAGEFAALANNIAGLFVTTNTDLAATFTTAAKNNEAKLDAINNNWNSLRETEKQKLEYAFGQAALYNLANVDLADEAAEANATNPAFGIGVDGDAIDPAIGFGLKSDGTSITGAQKFLTDALKAGQAKVANMNFAGHTIETQEDAQQALTALNDAIVQKDKTRAHLGALQNRLENTVSNLSIQAENLQSAESRISDVDVATEMTSFVRNQILTQSAVAMLGQANSMPQMAMQLIG